jgi:DNA-binding SARP family transcriptional activator
MLRFFLFGAPHFENADAAVPLHHSKPLALLAYLALGDQPRDRDTLLELLWPEFDASGARNNLRRELSRTRGGLGSKAFSSNGSIRVKRHTDRRKLPSLPLYARISRRIGQQSCWHAPQRRFAALQSPIFVK